MQVAGRLTVCILVKNNKQARSSQKIVLIKNCCPTLAAAETAACILEGSGSDATPVMFIVTVITLWVTELLLPKKRL